MRDEVCDLIDLYEGYQLGMLPFSGSISEQPAKMFEIFQIIEQYKLKAEQKSLEKSKQRMNSSGKAY